MEPKRSALSAAVMKEIRKKAALSTAAVKEIRRIGRGPTSWDRAGGLVLRRFPGLGWATRKPQKLDPGVNFFVAMLEQLGVQTLSSCEGHPNHFYIAFRASYPAARKIRAVGYFTVEIEHAPLPRFWSLRITRPTRGEQKKKTLRWAAHAWERAFGPLDFRTIRRGPPRGVLNKRPR